MQQDERKAAVSAYKERKPVAGIYALRCTATGQCWVGRAPDVATIENRLRFALKTASTPHRSLQAAARAHGADGFAFEIVERLREEDMALGRDRILANRHLYWCEALAATPL